MNKLLILLVLISLSVQGLEIPSQEAKKREFSKSIELNSQVIQLSNSSQSIMSLVSGHIEHYYVRAGQKIKDGDKIVLLKSIMLSKMTADFIAQKKQLNSLNKNCDALQNLYDKGMTSLQDLNKQKIQKDELLATLTSVKSQLETLGINTQKLTQATSDYILYAHSDGVVSAILTALHSGVQEDTPIISLVKEQAFYLKSFLPLEYASQVKIGQKISLNINEKVVNSHLTQILPKVDEVTQRIVLLSSIDEKADNLYINTYLASRLYFNETKKYVAVEKSALSFFNNEWVVFLPKEEIHESHDELGHDEHDSLEEEHHDEHAGHGHDEHEEEEVPYEIRVVKIITHDANYVGVKGLEVGEKYVSAKSYYVKSMLLKSSLGGHGH